MSLVSYAALPLASGGVQTSMSESGLIVLSIVAMVCLAALLIPVNLAGRAPRRTGRPSVSSAKGVVQGGAHLGDGRSVAPHRDEPAAPSGQEQAVPAPAAREGEGTAGRG